MTEDVPETTLIHRKNVNLGPDTGQEGLEEYKGSSVDQKPQEKVEEKGAGDIKDPSPPQNAEEEEEGAGGIMDPSASPNAEEEGEEEEEEEEGAGGIMDPSASQNAEEEEEKGAATPVDENPWLKGCLEDWDELQKEYPQLEESHRTYQKRLTEMSEVQQKCIKQIAHHRYRVKKIQDTIKRNIKDKELNPEEKSEIKELQRRLIDKKETFRELEECLPHKNGLYLSIILGQVNVSLLNKDDKFTYKHEYEQFKLVVSYIVMGLSFAQTFFGKYRWVDSILHFLLVWYYCTLTIRESILVVNGSRIKGWWMTHHFVSTICAGISLIWSDGWSYQTFRTQYVLFILYLSFVYIVQCYYQNGCLYRLRTLGKRHGMDITVEGFMSWMWKGLAFLLPLLFFGYFFQMYNAYVLWNLTYDERCIEWQVPVLSIITGMLASGNTLQTLMVIRDKLKKDGYITYSSRNKYAPNGPKSKR